jgi:hypothetical protein
MAAMHTILTNKPVKNFGSREAARNAALELIGGELDDWSYRAEREVYNGEERFVIAVYDESGEFVSYWRED